MRGTNDHRWIPLTNGQSHGALMFSLICDWTNGWRNSRDTGDLKRHGAHYDVSTVTLTMLTSVSAYLVAKWCLTLEEDLARIADSWLIFRWSLNYGTVWYSGAWWHKEYRQTSNISRTLVCNEIVDHSDVVGAAPTGANYIFILGLTPGFNGLCKDNWLHDETRNI